jgi:hypothetical protein
VPAKTIAIVLFMGLELAVIWGALSLIVWSRDDTIPALLIAPLWLTAEISTRWAIHPYLAGASALALIGLVPAAVILAAVRARGV